MDLGEVGWGDVDWIGLAKDRNSWRTLVNSVMNLRVQWNAGKLSSGLTSSGLSGSARLHIVSWLVSGNISYAYLFILNSQWWAALVIVSITLLRHFGSCICCLHQVWKWEGAFSIMALRQTEISTQLVLELVLLLGLFSHALRKASFIHWTATSRAHIPRLCGPHKQPPHECHCRPLLAASSLNSILCSTTTFFAPLYLHYF
jgi:hypothetical protein